MQLARQFHYCTVKSNYDDAQKISETVSQMNQDDVAAFLLELFMVSRDFHVKSFVKNPSQVDFAKIYTNDMIRDGGKN